MIELIRTVKPFFYEEEPGNTVLFPQDEDAIDSETATFDSWQECKEYVEPVAP